MNLKHLADNTLRIDSKKAAFREKEATTLLLHYILEVDRRKLFSEWKFKSLFDWCVKDLGLCEGSAHLRITAARLLSEVPEIENKLENGSLTLSNISKVNQFWREQKISTTQEKKEILEQVENLSIKETEKKLFEISGKVIEASEWKKRVSSKETQVTYILSDETLEAIEEVKLLIGKSLSTNELISLMASALKEKIEKDKFKQVEKPRRSKGTKVQGRVISTEVKRKAYERDKKCTNCGSKSHLNFDHIYPHALGGSNQLENIRLLCFNCNQRARMKINLRGPPT